MDNEKQETIHSRPAKNTSKSAKCRNTCYWQIPCTVQRADIRHVLQNIRNPTRQGGRTSGVTALLRGRKRTGGPSSKTGVRCRVWNRCRSSQWVLHSAIGNRMVPSRSFFGETLAHRSCPCLCVLCAPSFHHLAGGSLYRRHHHPRLQHPGCPQN